MTTMIWTAEAVVFDEDALTREPCIDSALAWFSVHQVGVKPTSERGLQILGCYEAAGKLLQ